MCIDCKARLKMARDALLNAKFAESIVHMAKGAAEIVGIKEKTGAAELEAKSPKRKSVKKNPGAAG